MTDEEFDVYLAKLDAASPEEVQSYFMRALEALLLGRDLETSLKTEPTNEPENLSENEHV